jgi:hypothetical protein
MPSVSFLFYLVALKSSANILGTASGFRESLCYCGLRPQTPTSLRLASGVLGLRPEASITARLSFSKDILFYTTPPAPLSRLLFVKRVSASLASLIAHGRYDVAFLFVRADGCCGGFFFDNI